MYIFKARPFRKWHPHQNRLARLPPPECVFGRCPRLVLDVWLESVDARGDGPPHFAVDGATRGSDRLHQRQGTDGAPGDWGGKARERKGLRMLWNLIMEMGGRTNKMGLFF